MNVHKRCKQNVANTCGINPKHMADLLQEMVSLKHEQNYHGNGEFSQNWVNGILYYLQEVPITFLVNERFL